MSANTKTYYAAVSEFTKAFAQRRFRFVSDVPTKVLELRISLIEEEEAELQKGIREDSKVEILDGLCDLVYVVVGTMIVCGISAEPFSATTKHDYNQIWKSIDALVSELRLGIPCHKRSTRYANDLLQALDRAGYPNLPKAFQVVHQNNMGKLWSHKPEDKTLLVTHYQDKFLVKNSQGKVIKPPGYTRPDLTPFIDLPTTK